MFQNFVNQFNAFFQSGDIWTNLAFLIPVVGGVLIFSFTFGLIKEIVQTAWKGKAGL